MGELITIEREEDKPRLACPHCKQHIYVDIDPWKKDMTKVMQDKCPKCHGNIIVGLIMIADVNMPKFLSVIRAIVNAAERATKILGG